MAWDTCPAQSLRASLVPSSNRDDFPVRFVNSIKSNPQNMNQVLPLPTETAVFASPSPTLVIKGDDTQRERQPSHSEPVLPATPPSLVSSAPPSFPLLQPLQLVSDLNLISLHPNREVAPSNGG